MKARTRRLIWICFSLALIVAGGLKCWRLSCLQPAPPLELDGQPAVLVFLKFRYVCECEQIVNDNARRQLAAWPVEDRSGTQLHQIDIERRVGAAQQYKVYRTPALLLLDDRGEIVWRQDGVTSETSDEFPLNLSAAESGIWELLQSQESLE